MSIVRGQPTKAIEYYNKATIAQTQYRNLHLISFWEIAIANLALWDIEQSLECWTTLKKEGTVSQFRTSHTQQPAYSVPVVESNLRFRNGGLQVASFHGGEEGD